MPLLDKGSLASVRLQRRERAPGLSGGRERGKKLEPRRASSGRCLNRRAAAGAGDRIAREEERRRPKKKSRRRCPPVSPPLDGQLSCEREKGRRAVLAPTPVASWPEIGRARERQKGCCRRRRCRCLPCFFQSKRSRSRLALSLGPRLFAIPTLVLRERQRTGARGPGGQRRQETGATRRCGGNEGAYLSWRGRRARKRK